jgi:hypothetical protein
MKGELERVRLRIVVLMSWAFWYVPKYLPAHYTDQTAGPGSATMYIQPSHTGQDTTCRRDTPYGV